MGFKVQAMKPVNLNNGIEMHHFQTKRLIFLGQEETWDLIRPLQLLL